MSTEQSTNSGEIEDLRDQIFLLIRLSLFFFILNRKASTKLPFHIDRRGMNFCISPPQLLPEILLWWASPKVTPKVYLLSCAPHLLHEDDPLDSLQHHEQWGVCLITGTPT